MIYWQNQSSVFQRTDAAFSCEVVGQAPKNALGKAPRLKVERLDDQPQVVAGCRAVSGFITQ